MLAVVVALLCSSDDGRMDVALCDIAQPNYTDAAVQLRISASAAAHERADGWDISLIIFYIIFFIYFLLSQAVANGYMLPPSSWRSGTDGSAYNKTARLTRSSTVQHLRNLRSTFVFFFFFFVVVHITHAHNSRNNTHMYEFIILIMDWSLQSQVQSLAGARRALSIPSFFSSFRPWRAVAELL